MPHSQEMTQRAIHIVERKREKQALRNQIIEQVRALRSSEKRYEELVEMCGQTTVQRVRWANQMQKCLMEVRAAEESLDRLLVEFDRVEANL